MDSGFISFGISMKNQLQQQAPIIQIYLGFVILLWIVFSVLHLGCILLNIRFTKNFTNFIHSRKTPNHSWENVFFFLSFFFVSFRLLYQSLHGIYEIKIMWLFEIGLIPHHLHKYNIYPIELYWVFKFVWKYVRRHLNKNVSFFRWFADKWMPFEMKFSRLCICRTETSKCITQRLPLKWTSLNCVVWKRIVRMAHGKAVRNETEYKLLCENW